MYFLLHFTYSHIHALIQALTFYFVMIVLTTVDWQATSHPKKNFMTRLFTVIPPILENSIIAPGTDDFKQDFFLSTSLQVSLNFIVKFEIPAVQL